MRERETVPNSLACKLAAHQLHTAIETLYVSLRERLPVRSCRNEQVGLSEEEEGEEKADLLSAKSRSLCSEQTV
jgi:hypothetical protein